MRIDLNAFDPQSVSADQTKKAAGDVTNRLQIASEDDQATLPEDKVSLSSLSTQALGLPEVRQGLVDSLRQSISSGQYKLDPSAIADAMLNQ
jgi:flagellar biosynthesis anti-sigma factor FlgM